MNVLQRPARVVLVHGPAVRVSGVSTQHGRVAITLRTGGRVIGTGRRSVRAGRRFTLTIGTRQKVHRGRCTLTTTLRPDNGHRWAGSERLLVR